MVRAFEDIIAESFGEPYEFYVNITDNLGLDPNTCNLYYNTNNSVWYTEVTLNLKSYPNRYYCTLPAQPANTIIYYHFNATDLAGSRNSNSEPKGVDFEFNVSRTKPKAAFEISQLQAYTYDSLVFSSTSQPEQLIEKYIWDFGDGSAFGEHQNETHMYVEPNIYTVRLKVIDRNGLWDEVSMILEIINSPPVAEINTEAIFVNTIPRRVDADNVIIGDVFEDDVIEIDCSKSVDKGGFIKKRMWDFGDGNEYSELIDDLDANGQFDPIIDNVIPVSKMPVRDQEERLNSSLDGKISYKYYYAGNYTIRFTVTDNDDTVSAVQTLSVMVKNQEPKPEPKYKVNGLLVFFIANDSNPIDTTSDYLLLNYTWDFGDSEIDHSPTPNHTYSKRDKYKVKLTVIDDDGSSASKTFYVDLSESNNGMFLVLGLGTALALILGIVILLFVVIRKNRAKRITSTPEQLGDSEPGSRAFQPFQLHSSERLIPRSVSPLEAAKLRRPQPPKSSRAWMGINPPSGGEQEVPMEHGDGCVKVKDILTKIQQK